MKKFTLFFSALLFSMMSFAGVVTFNPLQDKGNAGTDSNNATAFEITKSGVTLACSQGVVSSQGDQYRFFKNQTVTITSTVGNITSVEFTCTANGDTKHGPGGFTVTEGTYGHDGGKIGTWTGSAAEVVFTASVNQVRATQVVVTIDGEGGSETPEQPEEPETPETPETPAGVITCAEALAICLATGETSTTETYTIRGYVTEFKETYNTQFGNATFWIADEQGGGQVVLAYRVKPVNESDQAVNVNDYVEVVGTLVNYKGNTPEVNAGGTYTIVTAGEGGETPEEPETPVTPENPEGVITCAEALAICLATGETSTTETYTIRGYVTEFKETYNTQFGNATFWIADEQGGGQVVLAYRVKPVNESDQAVNVNDYVEVVGTLVNYKGNTPEVNAGGTYTIITAGEGGTTPEEPETPDVETVGDGTAENPYTVEDVLALNNTSKGPHYVKGFIIGQVNGASISSGLDTEAPFEGSTNSDGSVATQGTNLIIASVMGETTKIVAVQLPKGDLRTAFNLVENPDMLGKEVLICGNLEKYFGVPGIKSPTSIEVIGGDNGDVVNVTDMQYADAYYMEEDGVAYWDIQMYNVDETGEYYEMPIVLLGVEAKSKTALNGTYDMFDAFYGDSIDVDTYDLFGIAMDAETVGTLTIKNVNEEGDYSFVGSFVGEDGKTYKINTTANVYAEDDATGEEIELKEEGTDEPGDDPVTPPTTDGAVTFDADVDQGDASLDTSVQTPYTVSKDGVTMDVTKGVIATYKEECHYRIYKNQTLTLTSTVGNIVKVEFTCTANDDAQYGPGCFTVDGGEYAYSGAVGTWTGNAATVVFTASTNQVRATQVVVTLASTGTGVEDVVTVEVPVKVIENGQLMIIRGENVYNVLGAQVK